MFTTIMQTISIIAIITLVSLTLVIAYKLRAALDGADSPQDGQGKNIETRGENRKDEFYYRPSVTLSDLHLSSGNTKMYKLHTADKRLVGSLSEAFLRNEFGITPCDVKSYVIEVKITNIPHDKND